MIWNFDPVAFSLFGLDVRWYGLSYIFGFFLALHLGGKLQHRMLQKPLSKKDFENLTFGIFFAGIVGGRLGHFLFYEPETFVRNLSEVVKIWHGGMSIHGGILGSVLWALWWSRKNKFSLLRLADIFVLPLAITLIFGRIANFLNGELVGRATGTDWGMIFPHVDNVLRHPSQLYEVGKNILLSLFLAWLVWKHQEKKEGLLTAAFLVGYGILRFGVEYFREPESLIGSLTMGQILSLLMMVAAFFLAKCKHFWHNGS